MTFFNSYNKIDTSFVFLCFFLNTHTNNSIRKGMNEPNENVLKVCLYKNIKRLDSIQNFDT